MSAPIQASTTDTGSVVSPFTQYIGGIGAFGVGPGGDSRDQVTLAVAIGAGLVALIGLVLVLRKSR